MHSYMDESDSRGRSKRLFLATLWSTPGSGYTLTISGNKDVTRGQTGRILAVAAKSSWKICMSDIIYDIYYVQQAVNISHHIANTVYPLPPKINKCSTAADHNASLTLGSWLGILINADQCCCISLPHINYFIVCKIPLLSFPMNTYTFMHGIVQ